MSNFNQAKKSTDSGKLGDHPVGIAVGAAEGAALGTVAGLPGMAAGIAIGGVVGALTGKEVAQIMNPNAEEAYWSKEHQNRAYFDSVVAYDSYAPAYRMGIEAYVGRDFDEIDPQLAAQWEGARGTSRLTWDTAKLAVRDAYERLCDNE